VKVKSFAARSRSGAISQPTMRSLTGMSRAWSRLDFLRDSSSSLHDGAGLPAPICSLRQSSWMACAIGSADPSHTGSTIHSRTTIQSGVDCRASGGEHAVNRPSSDGGNKISTRGWVGPFRSVERGFELRGRYVVEVAVEAAGSAQVGNNPYHAAARTRVRRVVGSQSRCALALNCADVGCLT
jgi:hypothetical protein